jgi:hypothetical protein
MLAEPSADAPFVGPRVDFDLADGFERPHIWAVPTDAGKMADTQPVATDNASSAWRRDDWLDIDAPSGQQPAFVLPVMAERTAPSPADSPAGRTASVSASSQASTDAVSAPTLPESLRLPIRLPTKDESPRSDPEVPSLPSSSYMTGPMPGGYVTALMVKTVDFRDDTLVKADPGRITYPTENGQPEYRDADTDGKIAITATVDDDGNITPPTEWAVPTAYARGTKAAATATFQVKGTGPGYQGEDSSYVWIEGLWQSYGVSGLMFPKEKAYFSTDSDGAKIATYPLTQTKTEIPNYVDIGRTAGIAWRFSRPSAPQSWTSAGTSMNELFVTLGKPDEPVYHTAVMLSTRPSLGATTSEEVIDKT